MWENLEFARAKVRVENNRIIREARTIRINNQNIKVSLEEEFPVTTVVHVKAHVAALIRRTVSFSRNICRGINVSLSEYGAGKEGRRGSTTRGHVFVREQRIDSKVEKEANNFTHVVLGNELKKKPLEQEGAEDGNVTFENHDAEIGVGNHRSEVSVWGEVLKPINGGEKPRVLSI
ncbi:hypothetical protein ACSQ67_026164 [Phaseolus vulgaris]